MFREYDIRGRVNKEELCPENVYKIVKAYCKYLKRRNITRAVCGYDNRACSPAFAEAAVKALRECGIDVFFTGLSLSPLVYFAQYYLKCEGAVDVTTDEALKGLIRACIDRYSVVSVNNLKPTDTMEGSGVKGV